MDFRKKNEIDIISSNVKGQTILDCAVLSAGLINMTDTKKIKSQDNENKKQGFTVKIQRKKHSFPSPCEGKQKTVDYLIEKGYALTFNPIVHQIIQIFSQVN